MTRPFSYLTILFATLSCTPAPIHQVTPLVAEGRQNEVAATAKYKNEEIRVTGVVIQTGVDNFAHAFGEYQYGGIEVKQRQTSYPYIVLADSADATKDTAKCYFGEDDLEDVGKVSKGARPTARCAFQQYFHDRDRLILVLSGCTLE